METNELVRPEVAQPVNTQAAPSAAIARPGTPQAAGFDFMEFVGWIKARNALAIKAVNTRHERKPGESPDHHALRVQIDTSPRQWI